MIRYLSIFIVLLCSALAAPTPTHAQATAAEAAVVAASQKPAPSAATDPAQVKELIQTLNDPGSRAKLIRQLDLLTQQQAAQKPVEAEPVGSRLLKYLLAQIAEVSDEGRAMGQAFIGLPAAERWFVRQWSNPATRAHWKDLASSLATVLAAGAAASALVHLALRSSRKSIGRRQTTGLFDRVLYGLLRLLVGLMPTAVFGFVGYLMMSLLTPPAVVSLATLTIVNASLLVLIAMALSRFMLAPGRPNLRLLPVNDRPARFLHRWACVIVAIAAFGWFGISALRLLGLPKIAAAAALKIVGLSILVILVTLIIRKRRGVASWIRGYQAVPAGSRFTGFQSIRRRLAEIWHLLAVAYLIVTFGIWLFNIEDGFEFVLRGTAVSLLVIGGARLVVLTMQSLLDSGAAFSRDPNRRYPRLQQRVDVYRPIVRSSLSVAIWLVAGLALIEAWGLGTLDWFETPEGRLAAARIVSVALVVVSAIVIWEFVSAIIESYLIGAVKDGSPVQRSQRVRTLLPLLRNAFLIFLIVVVILIVLSEVGLNIAPLLAGAGVVGLAIGFGAQTLVKDVITGIFILFENTIAVGDVVDVGGGHSGLVEHFSIRTIKLRDNSGGVHTVPFSAVTTVNNMTKDFAFYVFNIKVDYAQDTDRVVEVVTELGKELQNDMGFCDKVLAPLEIVGIDSFGSDALVLQARFKTRPIQQWTVGREFNRRLKKRFDELKIPLTFPQSMLLLQSGKSVAAEGGEPSPDTPPPANKA